MVDNIDINGKRITIRNVAADAGVSASAVSKVLCNSYGVSDKLRANVQESIDRLGYRPSVAARGMRGKTFTIGILLVGLDNPFLSALVSGINSGLEKAGYKSLIAVGRAETDVEGPLIEVMIDFKMDGLIIIAPHLDGPTLDRFGTHFPITAIAHYDPEASTVDTVNSDDRIGARLAVDALISKGHEDIAMVSLPLSPKQVEVAFVREKGYLEAMRAAKLEDRTRIFRVTEKNTMSDQQIDAILTDPDRPRAVFCWSDLHGVSIVNRAHVLGLRVPEDIAVIGYDNSPVAALPLINLTSVRQSALKLGEVAATCVLTRLNNGRTDSEHHLLTPELVVRGSI